MSCTWKARNTMLIEACCSGSKEFYTGTLTRRNENKKILMKICRKKYLMHMHVEIMKYQRLLVSHRASSELTTRLIYDGKRERERDYQRKSKNERKQN